MKPVTTSRLARVSLIPALAATLATTPTQAQEAERLPGNRYAVANQTGAPLTCRYRVNSIASGGGGGSWQAASPIAAGGEFTRTAQEPGESLTLDCNADDPRGKAATVQPGRRYSAEKNSDGKVVVARVRA
jgi:hypothetical protein